MPIVKMGDVDDADDNENWMGFRKTLEFEPKYLVYKLEASDDDIKKWLDEQGNLGKTFAYLSHYRIIAFADHQEAIDCFLRLG